MKQIAMEFKANLIDTKTRLDWGLNPSLAYSFPNTK